MKKTLFIFSLLLASLVTFAENAIVLSSPNVKIEYQLTSVSPNGKWACGEINDGNYRGFCWNLETNEITETTALGAFSSVSAIANDGTIAAVFESAEITENGALLKLAGTWKDGKWTLLDHMTDDGYKVTESWCYGISPNGKNIAGIVNINGKYKPAIWVNGDLKILPCDESLPVNMQEGSVIYVNNDATLASGWTYTKIDGGRVNRTATYWKDGKRIAIDSTKVGPFSVAGKISENDKYLVSEDRILNLTDATASIPPADTAKYVGFEIHDVSNSGKAIGCCDLKKDNIGQFAAIWDGKDWINIKNSLLKDVEDIVGYDLFLGVGISSDEKTIGVMAFDEENIPRALIIKLGADTINMPATALRTKALEGINAVELTWNSPFKNNGLNGYNIYRADKKINDELITENFYVDMLDKQDTYSYTVKAVYDKESVASNTATVTLSNKELSGVRNLIGKQNRINDAKLMWDVPTTSLPRLSMISYNDQVVNFGGGEFSFECGTKFSMEELAAYKNNGLKITGATFYPMSKQNGYVVSFYDAADTTLTPIYTYKCEDTEFLYGEENTIIFKEPFEIPEGKDIIMGITYDVTDFGGYNVAGVVFNKCKAGYTDLLRQVGQEEFFSLYENAQQNENGAYEYKVSWATSALFGKDNKSAIVKEYIVNDGKAEKKTHENSLIIENLKDGKHTFAVSAVYENDEVSEKSEIEVIIKEDKYSVYKPVSDITKSLEQRDLKLNWTAPTDNEESTMTYAVGEENGGMVGSEENQYSYFVASRYRGDILQDKDGYMISAIKFYPLCDADFTLYLFEDQEEVACIELERETGYTIGKWNTVKLENPIKINKYAEYFLSIDCYDVTPEKGPIAKDAYHAFSDMSDLFSIDGEKYSSVSLETGILKGNWMIGLVVSAAEGKPLPIKGYNVAINGKNANENLLTDTKFETSFEKDGKYKVNVNVVYDNEVGEVESENIILDINLTAVEYAELNELFVEKNINVLNVTAETAVESIHIYNMSGALVAESGCNMINIDNLNNGIYILKASLENGDIKSLKINL